MSERKLLENALSAIASRWDATFDIAPPLSRNHRWGSKKGLERPLNASISKHPLQSRNLAPAELHARQHAFQPTSILRPVRCEHCGDKMWGMGEQRCAGEHASDLSRKGHSAASVHSLTDLSNRPQPAEYIATPSACPHSTSSATLLRQSRSRRSHRAPLRCLATT